MPAKDEPGKRVPRWNWAPGASAHGISSIEDLEICITSNVVTGVAKRIEDHPVRRLYDAGVPIVLNTDDPAMFGCTLVGEFRLAA